MSRPPLWFTRDAPLEADDPRPTALRLLVLHWDRYPTARAVYRDVLPARGHRVVWIERGEWGQEDFRIETVGLLEAVESPHPAPRKQGFWLLRGASNRLRPLWTWVRKWLWTFRRARTFRPDFVQARDRVGDALIAWTVAMLTGSRFAYQIDFLHFEGHLNRTDGERGWETFRRRLGWRLLIRERDFLLRRARPAFAISETMRELFVERGLRPERVHVFPVGVGRDFGAALEGRDGVRARLGIVDEPVVVYLGSLHPSRNTERIRDILRGIVARDDGVRLMILGKGVASVRDLMREWGVEDRVVHAGEVPHEEVPAMLAASDVGLFPIDVDVPRGVYRVSSPLKVAEYMAAAIATVSSPVPEAVQLLDDSDGGVVVEDNRVESFVDATLRCCRDREHRRAMGRRAHEYVTEFKEFDVLGRVVESVYLRHRDRR